MKTVSDTSTTAAPIVTMDLEVETMFNKSKKSQKKEVFVQEQNEKNHMYKYSNVITCSPKDEQFYGENVDTYFQACMNTIGKDRGTNN